MEWIRWAWAAIALLLLIAEIFVSGFVLICFAVGAGAAALVAFLDYDFLWQVVVFITVSLVMVVLMRPLSVRLTRAGGRNRWGIDRVVGKHAVVLIDIDPIQARGRVRVDREEWQATSAEGTHIPAGAIVEVLSVEGTRLKVRPTAHGAAAAHDAAADSAPADGAPADGAPADGAPADGAPADGAPADGAARS